MKKVVLFLIFLMAVTLTGIAQSRIIQGIVHTLDSIPLIGAEVNVKSTDITYLTNVDGGFVAECALKDKLIINAPGFFIQRIKITEEIKIVAVNLKMKHGQKKDSFSIGYGSSSEESKSGAISRISNENVRFSNYDNVFAIIRDNFSGVQVINNEIIIRGARSLISSNAALIVIDGVISDGDVLNAVSPQEVMSIDIIKDATAAVYGSRGTNGVVLIETFKGN